MGNIQASNSTLYSQVVNSKPAQFAKDNPVLAGAGTLGSGVILKEAASRSELVATGIKKGLVPAVAAGAALVGASMVKDAIQNDWKNFGSKENNTALSFLGKTAGGTALALTGTEVAGRSLLGVSPLGKAAEFISDKVPADVLYFGALSAGGAAVAVKGVQSMKENGLTLGNAAMVGGGASAATGLAGAGAFFATQFTPHVNTVMKVSDKANGLVGSAALGLASVALGKASLEAIQEGKSGKAVLTGVGAATAGAAAIHVLGNATGVEALSNLGQKVFLKNPLLAGSVTAVAMAGAGYYMYAKSHDDTKK